LANNVLCSTATGGGGGGVLPNNSHGASTVLGTSLVAKAATGSLYGFYGSAITGGSRGYCIAYNASAAPAPGLLTGTNVLSMNVISRTAAYHRARHTAWASPILVSNAATAFTYATGTLARFASPSDAPEISRQSP